MDHKLLFAKVDELYNEYLKVLEDVCNIESPTLFKAGVDAVGEYFRDMAKERGWKVEVFEQEVVGNVVIITMNSDVNAPPICFSGHIDTVHPVGLFGDPTTRSDEEKIYAPGALDCKGGVVASFLAMDALDRCGFRGRPVMLLIQSDEENGSSKSGHATINYICERAKDAIAFLNTEGATLGEAVIARKGILRYEFKIHGMARHSSICYQNAANAIAEAAYKIIELEKLKDADGLTCNCGVISGGTVANTVAEWCSFQADIRFSTYDEMKEAERIVRELSDRSFVEGCSCEVTQISSRPPMVRVEMNELLLEKIREINSSVGFQDLKPVKGNGGSDAAYTTQHGIPTLDNFGVRGGGIHSVCEYVIKRSLAESAKQLAAVAWYIK